MITLDPTRDIFLLYEMTVYNKSLAAQQSLYFSDIEYRSDSSATPASTHYRPRIINPGTITLDLIPAWTKGLATLGVGAIELGNADRQLDTMVKDCVFDGWPVDIYLAFRDAAGAVTKRRIARAIMEQPDSGIASLTIPVRSPLYALDKPVLSTTFLGTGGLEGPPEVKGVFKPYVFGACYKMPLFLIDAATQTYFWTSNDSCVADPPRGGQVYDEGLPLTFTVEYASVALMQAAVLTAGEYAFAKDHSALTVGVYIRLGQLPNGQLTIDGRDPGHSGVSDILSVVATLSGNPANVNDAFACRDWYYPGTYPTGQLGVVGIYVGDGSITYAQVIGLMASGVVGWVFVAPNGYYNTVSGFEQDVWVISNFPDDASLMGSVGVVIPENDVLDIKRLGNPKSPGEGIPTYLIAFDSNKNEIVQTSGLGATVPAATRAAIGQQYITRTKTDATVLTKYPLAQSIKVTSAQSNLDTGHDYTQATVDGLFAGLKQAPDFFSIRVKLSAALISYVTITQQTPGGTTVWRWLPCACPSFCGKILGVKYPGMGFLITGNGTKCGVLAFSLDLAAKEVTYTIWTTYLAG